MKATPPPSLATRVGAIGGAMVCLAGVSFAGLLGSTPTSILTVLVFAQGGGPVPAVLFGPGLFLLWSLDLLAGRVRLPLRSIVLTWIVAACSGTWFAIGWAYGVRWQRTHFVLSLAASNLLIFVSLLLWARMLRKSPHWWSAFVFHGVLFAWPLLFGFPWLGEAI